MQDFTYKIGDRIKDARNRKKISQTELAKRIGIKQPSLSDIEKGSSTPREATLIALVRELEDDLGDENLRKHLPKHFSPEELAQLVNKFGDDAFVSFRLDLFVFELSKLNKRFRKMLNPRSLEIAAEKSKLISEMMDLWDEEDIIRHENLVKNMTQRMNEDVQDLGDIDQFNIEESIKKHDNITMVLRDWFDFDQREYPEDYGVDFTGWNSLTFERKVAVIRNLKTTLDISLEDDE